MRVFRVGGATYAFAEQYIAPAECAAETRARVVIRADGSDASATMQPPAVDQGYDQLQLIGDVDGDGRVEFVYTDAREGLYVVQVDPGGGTTEVFEGGEVNAEGCPC